MTRVWPDNVVELGAHLARGVAMHRALLKDKYDGLGTCYMIVSVLATVEARASIFQPVVLGVLQVLFEQLSGLVPAQSAVSAEKCSLRLGTGTRTFEQVSEFDQFDGVPCKCLREQKVGRENVRDGTAGVFGNGSILLSSPIRP